MPHEAVGVDHEAIFRLLTKQKGVTCRVSGRMHLVVAFRPRGTNADLVLPRQRQMNDDRRTPINPTLLWPTAAWDMQAFWYNVTKAGGVKYGPTVVGSMVQITRNGNSVR